MKLTALVSAVLGTWFALTAPPRRRDERGLSQSAETAVLIAGAVVVAAIIVRVITAFVNAKLPK